ncbi:SRPBCC family protein [Trinickia violacea]
MHPYDAEVIHVEMDVRVGGRFRIVMRALDGEEHDVSGTFREVVRDARLVYTWAWRSTPERESLVTLTLRLDGEATLLTLEHEQFFDEAARESHQAGWNQALDGLERQFA